MRNTANFRRNISMNRNQFLPNRIKQFLSNFLSKRQLMEFISLLFILINIIKIRLNLFPHSKHLPRHNRMILPLNIILILQTHIIMLRQINQSNPLNNTKNKPKFTKIIYIKFTSK